MKKLLCLFAMTFMLFSSVSFSQTKVERSTYRSVRYRQLAKNFEIFLVISKPLRDYYAKLFKTNFDQLENAAEVFASLMPTYTAHIQEQVLKKYGVDISSIFTKAGPELPPELARFGRVIRFGSLLLTGLILLDTGLEHLVVYDLTHNSNFTHAEAEAAAEYISDESALAAGRLVDELIDRPLEAPYETLAKIANFLEELVESNDRSAYNPNEGDLPGGIGGGGPRTNDGGLGGNVIGGGGPTTRNRPSDPGCTYLARIVYLPDGTVEFHYAPCP